MKKVVFTFGRMNPPTIGHNKLVDKVRSVARAKGAEARIYLSQSHDSRKNPLPYIEKVKLAQKIWPDMFIPIDKDAKTVFHILTMFEKLDYDEVTLVVGSDRVKEFESSINKYIKPKEWKLSGDKRYNPAKDYTFDFHVVSAGERDPDATGVEGMSASKMREFVAKDDVNSFISGFPSKNIQLARKAFSTLKRYLKETAEPIAIFVSGGPASGKDIVIRELKETFNFKEIEPKDLSGFCNQNLIVNGTPEDFARPKVYLENLGYSTAYINVIIDEDVSKERNIFRSRPLTEEIRIKKLSEYNRKAKTCSEMFDVTHVFNNSVDYNDNPEYVKEQLETMKTDLNEKLLDALKDWMKNTNSPLVMQKALQEYFKRVDKGSSKFKSKPGVREVSHNENIAAEVANDFGVAPRKFISWIQKNTKVLGLERKYVIEERLNEKFEGMINELSKEKLGQYIKKASDEGPDYPSPRKFRNRLMGVNKADAKIKGRTQSKRNRKTTIKVKATNEETRKYSIYKSKKGYGVSQKSNRTDWDHSLHHGYHKTQKDAVSWAKKHAGKYPHEIKTLDEDHGAGFWGTPELTKKLLSQTPGQENVKMPPPEGDKYNEPRAKVYGTHVKKLKGKYPGPVNESVKVEKKNYTWGKMVTVYKGSQVSYPLHPEHIEIISKMQDGDTKMLKLETGRKVMARMMDDKIFLMINNAKSTEVSVRKASLTEQTITEAIGQYDDERTASKFAYDAAITQMDPWVSLHVVQHMDETYSVILDMNLKSRALPGDKVVATYNSADCKHNKTPDPASVPKKFKDFLGR